MMVVVILLLLAALAPQDDSGQERGLKLFREHVRPILETKCLKCHGGEATKNEFDLSTRETLLSTGARKPSVVAGNAQGSRLVRIIKHDVGPGMPFKQERLPDEQIAKIVEWIDAGAPYDKPLTFVADPKDFWSLRPLRRPEPPEVKDEKWSRTPIDRFILAALEARELTPSPEADRRTLIRRATFDLHGLPPTPEEIEVFEKEGDFEKLLDRLLASPRYGERWGRHWLDVARYADTHGYDKDKRRPNAWPYRDYVIRALNDDKPYARFVQEQVAGDVLFPGEADGVVATGFLAAGPWDFVGHTELREGTTDKEITRALDRDEMVTAVSSVFLSVTAHCARCHDHKYDPIPQKDYYRLQAVFAGVERGDRSHGETPEQAARRAELEKSTKSPTNGWHSAISNTPDATKWVQVDLGKSLPIDEVRLVPARPTDFPDTRGFGFPLRFKVEVSDDPTWARAETIADHTASDFKNPGDEAVTIRAGRAARHVRVTATRLWQRTGDWVFALAELEAVSGGKVVSGGAEVTSLDSIEAGRWGRRHLVDGFTSRARVGADAELRSLPPAKKVYAVLPRAPRPIHLLHRGEVQQPREAVGAGALSAVFDLDAEFALDKPEDEGTRRAALAEWLTEKANALTWRSIVNRAWHHHFGRGIVDTPNDFGRHGGRPSHRELLDWLAVEFRDGGQSLKKLHRLIMTSAVYRQGSPSRPDVEKVDADNRLLWRANRRRLDAESLRDSILFASGALDPREGGPGFDLFHFKDDHSPHYDYARFNAEERPETHRRTVYRFVVRSVGNPFLDALDCPDPSFSTAVRTSTNTALQALALLNDPLVLRESRRLASKIDGVDAAFRRILGRAPTEAERLVVGAYAAKHGLANACRMLFNANEFVYVD